jgi:uncharacterized protein YvpB
MDKILEVPYKSQWDPDADDAKNDCGCSSLAMLLSYLGKEVTTNEVYEATGEKADDGTNFEQLVVAAKKFGFDLIGSANKTLNDLKSLIDNSILGMVVVHYGFLNGRQDPYKGPHILVVSGYDDKYIYTEDPDFAYSRRDEGHKKVYLIEDFDKGWASTLDGNYPRNLWYINKPTNSNPTNTEEKPTELEDALEKMRKSRDEWKRVYKEEVDKNTELMDKAETDRKTIENLQTAIATNKTPLGEYKLSLLLIEILSRLTTQATKKMKNTVLQVKKVGGKE